MKRLRFTRLWLILLALAPALTAWSVPPQPGLPIVIQPGPNASTPLTLKAGKVYRVGWFQQDTFLNVKISLAINQGQYEAYLTTGSGVNTQLIATRLGPPASGTPLFQRFKLDAGDYFVYVVRRGEEGSTTTWDVGNSFRVLGAAVVLHSVASGTATTSKPYEADVKPLFIPNGALRFAVTAQWTHDPSLAEGAENWGRVGPPAETCGFKSEFGTFRFGQTQSPINISNSEFDGRRTLSFNYPAAGLPFVVENTGNTIEVPAENNSGFSLTYNGDQYNLVQFHVHAPSEHQLNGQSFGMEVHLVHQNKLGQLAVVGVLLNAADGAPRSGLDTMIEGAPESVGEAKKADSKIAVDFVPQNGNFYFYNGSLTTPPCTEGVLWIVAADTRTVTRAALAALHELIKKFPSYNNYENNNRPIPALLPARPVFRRFQ
jgi:carbonic anhydrase